MRAGKYNAKRTMVDNHWFHSKAEAERYLYVLKPLMKAGEIFQLELQPAYKLYSKQGALIGKYIADFAYFKKDGGGQVVEDVKGVRTALYRWKKKHAEADYFFKVMEV